MAAYTSSQTGNWSSASTWGGAGVPGNGDTATVNNAVTVDVNTIVGTSPSDQTTIVLQINNPGTLTIATGVSLTVRGNAGGHDTSSTSKMTLNAGAILEFDASQATTTTTQYNFNIESGVAGAANGFKLICNGTSGSPCTVRSNAGGGNALFTFDGATDNGGRITATHTNFLRIASSTAIANWVGPAYSFDHCIFNACGNFSATCNNSQICSITNCTLHLVKFNWRIGDSRHLCQCRYR
jgi:hypothetical protein